MKDLLTQTTDTIRAYIAESGGIFAIIAGFLCGISSFTLSLLVLLAIIGADFVTGCLASYYSWKEGGKPKNDSGYVISSEKARETVKKFISYGMAILLSYLLAWVTLRNPELSLLGMPAKTIPEYTTIILMSIESFSILENLKKMGIDIIGGIQEVSQKAWELFNNVKKGEFKGND